jgi:hypothetical protein
MPQIDLEPDAAVQAAAEWIANQRDHVGRAIVPEVKQRFGLATPEVIEAIRRAQNLRWARAT